MVRQPPSLELLEECSDRRFILLLISDKCKLINKLNENLNYKSAIIIGVFQVLSLIPGVSRSGITITTARFLKFNRYDAAKISFLLSIPTLGEVSIYGIQNLIFEGGLIILFYLYRY